jgi:DNA mismatch endonuclease (patch repair protein)
MDVFSKSKRSEVMSRIRGRGNRSTERRMAAMLRARRISGWQMHRTDVAGKPDFYFPGLQIALFIDGCFWHACPRCSQIPRQNVAFWSAKLTANAKRDARTRRELNRAGISVIRLWEHDLEKLTVRCRSVLKRLQICCATRGNNR